MAPDTLKLLLIVMASVLIGYSFVGIARGRIYSKGVSADRSTQPGLFWFTVLVYWAFGGMLVYFALFGKFK
ncbi:MAG: hypothetical protein D6806_03885 [Deltaproteobacteria bacterium]|nr:MAG: hypothetical protein D6806_03885 [Deltaproteobacteria bacterium]